MAAFFSSSRANFQEMARSENRLADSDACAAALGDEAVQAAPSKLWQLLCSVDGDAPTAAPPSRGAKRPSEAADGAAVAKCPRRGTAHASKYIGVSWDKSNCKWRARLQDAAGRTLQLGYFAVEDVAARAYDAAVIRENLTNIRPMNSGKDGVLLEKPEMSSEFRGVTFSLEKKRWQAKIKRGKCHGLDGKMQHLGYHEDEHDAALAVDSFTRLHMPGTALNFPTLDELYELKLKAPLLVRLTYDVGVGRREVIAAQLTEVKYDPSHESVWGYLVEFEDAQSAELLGLEATLWDPVTGDHSQFAACDYRQAAPRSKGPSARKKATPTPKGASPAPRSL
ncbi:hypothetical protein M885DRAFT_176488 [Pelagophyceae sp. CCMP2097]|nr:hypothetical protein M885DRAFT_176488 [Pelagophyceae sp. CCMP2097]